MSLRLTVKELRQNGLKNTDIIYVEGSQAGQLISQKGKTIDNFLINCNIDDILKIKIFKQQNFKNPFTTQPVGEVMFSARRYYNEHRYQEAFYNTQKAQSKYETHIFDRQEKPAGVLSLSIRYIKQLYYEGEKIGILQESNQKQPVRIYQGASQTKNLFSYFDQGNSDKHFNAIESLYRDDTWGKR